MLERDGLAFPPTGNFLYTSLFMENRIIVFMGNRIYIQQDLFTTYFFEFPLSSYHFKFFNILQKYVGSATLSSFFQGREGR